MLSLTLVPVTVQWILLQSFVFALLCECVCNAQSVSFLGVLQANSSDADDYFGYSVSTSGVTVVVGASQEDSRATGVNGDQRNDDESDSGAAYVFVRSGTAWTQQAYLKASNTQSEDYFAYSVSISGNTIVVGAYGEDSDATGVNGYQINNAAVNSGAAYVFVRVGTAWTQNAYLKPSNTQSGDYFGWSVSISGPTIVVGAWQEDSNATDVNGDQNNNYVSNSGAAYVFARLLLHFFLIQYSEWD
jgi:hypothetical protein